MAVSNSIQKTVYIDVEINVLACLIYCMKSVARTSGPYYIGKSSIPIINGILHELKVLVIFMVPEKLTEYPELLKKGAITYETNYIQDSSFVRQHERYFMKIS